MKAAADDDPQKAPPTLEELDAAFAAVWREGMEHTLSWLGQRGYIDAFRKDNPYREAEG